MPWEGNSYCFLLPIQLCYSIFATKEKARPGILWGCIYSLVRMKWNFVLFALLKILLLLGI